MPYREENSNAFVPDVFGRVMIPIMPRATIRTSPKTIRERKLLIAMTTVRTQLRRRKPATDEDEVSSAPPGFVFDLPERLTMRGVVDRLGKLGFRHAFEVQRLARDCAVLPDDRSGKFVGEVGAAVGDLLVFTGQRPTGFRPIRAPFLATGQTPGGALYLAFGFSEEARVLGDSAVGISGEPIEPHIDANRRFSFDDRLGQVRQVEFSDQRYMPLAGRVTLERRAFQGQIAGLRLPDLDPPNLRNIDASVFELNPLRDAERLIRAVFLLESGKARPLLKEVVERSFAVGESLLQQLRVYLFQPLEAGLVFQLGQFNRKLRPGDGFAGFFVDLLTARQSPIEDEPSRARKPSKRRFLFGGRINPESVDLSFRHSISRSLRIDVFGNRLLGHRAGGRSEIARRPHARHSAKMLEFFSQNARRIALQSKHDLANSQMLWAIEEQMDVVRFDGKMHDLDIDLRRFFPQQCDQPLGYVPDKYFATTARYPDDVIPDRSHRAFVVSISIRDRHILLSGRRRVNGASQSLRAVPNSSPRYKQGAFFGFRVSGTIF